MSEQKKAYLEAQQKQISEEIESIKLDAKKAVAVATEERLRSVDAYRESSKKEQEEMLNFLSMHTEELAVTFADSLIKE